MTRLAEDAARLFDLGAARLITITPTDGRLRIVAEHADGGQTVAWADGVSVKNGVISWTLACRPIRRDPT